jgi:hypothetical protein
MRCFLLFPEVALTRGLTHRLSSSLVEPKRVTRLTDDVSLNLKNIVEYRKAHRSWESKNDEKNQQEDRESKDNKANGRILDNGKIKKGLQWL